MFVCVLQELALFQYSSSSEGNEEEGQGEGPSNGVTAGGRREEERHLIHEVTHVTLNGSDSQGSQGEWQRPASTSLTALVQALVDGLATHENAVACINSRLLLDHFSSMSARSTAITFKGNDNGEGEEEEEEEEEETDKVIHKVESCIWPMSPNPPHLLVL